MLCNMPSFIAPDGNVRLAAQISCSTCYCPDISTALGGNDELALIVVPLSNKETKKQRITNSSVTLLINCAHQDSYLCTLGNFVHFCHVCLHNVWVKFMYLKYEQI